MNDEHYMRQVLALAQAASENDEVPVGALILDPSTGEIIATAANGPIGLHDPTAHAEVVVLRLAAQKLGNYRLTGLHLYVSLEPCTMCAGAISHARISRLIYGASDPKGGAVAHGVKFFDTPTCHSKPDVTSGVLAEECSIILKDFFKQKRAR
ncbi:MAG TPA: nucleoside deaminase [Hellea balneolensis]|uniref:tRNA-specific adenosine deaminase n=1 Tax=Hellea balneolensis TaxID=287478 RepID=A0A7C3C1B9_9PROT|nr:nucleoside deaminase [Hellea balneolensis]